MQKAIVVVMAALVVGVIISSGFLWTLDNNGHQLVSEMDVLKTKNEEQRQSYQLNFQPEVVTGDNVTQ